MEIQRDRLRQYLLGNLSLPDTEEIDLLVIEDEEFSAEIVLAESELIEDHLEGSLSDAESGLFKTNFLVSAARKEQLRETRLLTRYARTARVSEKEEITEPRSSFSLRKLISGFRPLMVGVAMIAVVVAAGVVWQIYFGSSATPLEKEYAEMNRRDLSGAEELSKYSAISLSSGTFRDSGSAVKQNADTLTETTLFRLVPPAGAAGGSIFKAKVSRGGTLIFTLDGVRLYQNPNGPELRLLLPKSILQKGQYLIKIESSAGGDAGTFAFVIE